jgi:uncharacterized protein
VHDSSPAQSSSSGFENRSAPPPGGLRRMITLLVLLGVMGGVLMIAAPLLAEHLLYHPSTADPGPPPAVGAVRGEDIALTTSDGVRIHGWWYEVPDAPAILLLHGNAGHIGHRGFIAHELVRRGWSVLLLEYRGYGNSEGRPSEQGLYRDAQAGFEFLVERTGAPERVALFGRSLGAAVAARLVAGSDAGALILDSPFTSLRDIAGAVYPFLPGVLFRRLEGRYDTRGALAGFGSPLLVITASRDRLIPPRMGRELFDGAAGPKEWYDVEGGGHNDLIDVAGPGYFDRLDDFLRRHLTRARAAESETP